MNKFQISIIGRPNVGKSTLYNKLAKNSRAIVDDVPGVTRDRREQDVIISGKLVCLVDTAGLEESEEGSLSYRMMKQTEKAIDSSNLCLLVIDGKIGVTFEDKFFAKWLRKKGSEVILIVNKCETKKSESFGQEAYKLGFERICFISAEHKLGFDSLHDSILPYIENLEEEEVLQKNTISIAIVGRPNVGKSTFLNQVLREERLLTGPEAGITRDSISIDWVYKDKEIKLIDTAGIRKNCKINSKLEELSVEDSKKSVNFANIVVVMLDALQPFEKQDITITDYAIKEGRGIVFAINKWDTIVDKDEYKKFIKKKLGELFRPIAGVSIVYLSALNNDNVYKVIDEAINTYSFWNKKISTSKLNEWLREALHRCPPPLASNKKPIKIKYITQNKIRPPTFMVFANKPSEVPVSYVRYLSNNLREVFDLRGVPIRVTLRKSDNPYV
jgi:GTPase